MRRFGSAAGVVAVAAAVVVSSVAVPGAGAAARTAAHRTVVAGSWGNAEELPGTAALNKGGDAEVLSLSCGAPGDCSAGGLYYDRSGSNQASVVTEG